MLRVRSSRRPGTSCSTSSSSTPSATRPVAAAAHPADFGVSRLMVRAALDDLVREGYLVRPHGSGNVRE